MNATVAGARITRGIVRVPRRGALWADVELEGGDGLDGATAIAIGDASLACSFVPGRGGTALSASRYTLRAALAWDTEVGAKEYQSHAGVRLHTVLTDLAKAVGQAGRITLPAGNSVLGGHYQRRGATTAQPASAREILSSLVPAWYADSADVIVCADRPAGEVATSDVRVLGRNLASRTRTIGTETPGAFVPGLSFEGDVIDSVTFNISREGIVLQTWGVT